MIAHRGIMCNHKLHMSPFPDGGGAVAEAPKAGSGLARRATYGCEPMPDRTLVICKPDAVERGLVGAILSRFEQRNLRIAALELRTLDEELLARHYEEHIGKGFYPELVAFMSRGP